MPYAWWRNIPPTLISKSLPKSTNQREMHANPLIEFMEDFFRQAYDGFCTEYVVRTWFTYCTRSSVCLRRRPSAICKGSSEVYYTPWSNIQILSVIDLKMCLERYMENSYGNAIMHDWLENLACNMVERGQVGHWQWRRQLILFQKVERCSLLL